MATNELPEPFQELVPWVDQWGRHTEAERNFARVTSAMPQIQAFYDAIFPRMEAIVAYLADYDHQAPAEVLNLSYLAKSCMEAALCVELFNAPTVPEGFDHRRLEIVSPG